MARLYFLLALSAFVGLATSITGWTAEDPNLPRIQEEVWGRRAR